MKLMYKKAFTLIELLVVVSIILILSLVIMTAVYNARKESRDTARATTAEQLSLGIRLYKEAEGKYPVYPNGVELGVGNSIDAELAPFIKEIPKDPLTQGTSDEYEYWYYPNFLCKGQRHDVVLVKKMEMDDNGNFNEVCGGGAILPMETGWIPRAYAQPAACAVLSPTTLRLNQNGSLTESTSVTWGVGGQAQIDLIYPDGTSRRQWDRNPSPSTVPASQEHISPIMQPGMYSVSVSLEATGQQCSLPLTVNPYYSQSTYYSQSAYEYVQSSYYSQSSYTPQPENYTSAAYVVFIN